MMLIVKPFPAMPSASSMICKSFSFRMYLSITAFASFRVLQPRALRICLAGGSTVLTLTDNASVGTVYLANGDNTVALNGTATVYAKDNSTIRYAKLLINHTASATTSARTLNTIKKINSQFARSLFRNLRLYPYRGVVYLNASKRVSLHTF